MREALPNRRETEVFAFIHDGIKHKGSVSKYADGRPAEIFLDSGKPGSAVQAFARDAAVFASLALQYGCPLQVLHSAVTRTDTGEAAGPGGKLLDLVVEGMG